MLASTKASRPLAALALSAGRVQAQRNASSIANKYSHAAYKAALAKSPETLNKVQEELASVARAIREVPQLSAFVSNPLLAASERAAGLEALYKAASGASTPSSGAGAGVGAKKEPTEVTKNLIAVLSENGRLGEVVGVIEGFNELVAKYKGELEVVVTSAQPLTRDVLGRLEMSLRQSEAAKKAKVLKVTNKVNPSVLGGILVDVGDKTIDLSVASRVTKINSLLQQTV